MRKFLLLTFAVSVYFTGKGQQLEFTSQYLQHNSMYNPAAAGIANKNLVGVSYRDMWSSFPGNPKTYMVYADANFPKLKSGFGGYV